MALIQHLFARQADRIGQPQPGFDAAFVAHVAEFESVVVEDALHPAAPHLAIRAVREDGRILERDRQLVAEAVGHPASDLLRRGPPLVEHAVERMVDVIRAATFAQALLEFLARPGRVGGLARERIHRTISMPSSQTVTPERASSARSGESSSRMGLVLLTWIR